ncbi:MAG: three-Cys-motif partner protein TcmP [Bacillota bacterium]|uniref:three-Cys-motif partner protein TcmP n=1 Tax=Desulforudis sp. DRI-14 TaxID=3459793 RepID=UPI003479098A
MTVPKETVWELDPHTRAKHDILKRYLQAWYAILNTYYGRIVYIDGFCGPGRYKGGEPGSPLVAIDAAVNHRRAMQGELVFLFIDGRQDRIDHLRYELDGLSIPRNFDVSVKCGLFHEELVRLLDDVDNMGAHLAPTFAFIDPFGFKGIPFAIIERLLQHPRCEVFITFMVDALNRFLEHPNDQVVEHIVDAFGTEKCLEIAQMPGDRIQSLRVLYQDQLSKIAKFIRYFEMRDRNNRTQYYLFFATNHRLGHVKMKESMWKVNPDGDFLFSDATNPRQMVLFEKDTTHWLAEIIQQKFLGLGRPILCERVREFVEDETAYLKKHMTAALKVLEASNAVQVAPLKADGKKRRTNTYPDEAIITFLEH